MEAPRHGRGARVLTSSSAFAWLACGLPSCSERVAALGRVGVVGGVQVSGTGRDGAFCQCLFEARSRYTSVRGRAREREAG